MAIRKIEHQEEKREIISRKCKMKAKQRKIFYQRPLSPTYPDKGASAKKRNLKSLHGRNINIKSPNCLSDYDSIPICLLTCPLAIKSKLLDKFNHCGSKKNVTPVKLSYNKQNIQLECNSEGSSKSRPKGKNRKGCSYSTNDSLSTTAPVCENSSKLEEFKHKPLVKVNRRITPIKVFCEEPKSPIDTKSVRKPTNAFECTLDKKSHPLTQEYLEIPNGYSEPSPKVTPQKILKTPKDEKVSNITSAKKCSKAIQIPSSKKKKKLSESKEKSVREIKPRPCKLQFSDSEHETSDDKNNHSKRQSPSKVWMDLEQEMEDMLETIESEYNGIKNTLKEFEDKLYDHLKKEREERFIRIIEKYENNTREDEIDWHEMRIYDKKGKGKRIQEKHLHPTPMDMSDETGAFMKELTRLVQKEAKLYKKMNRTRTRLITLSRTYMETEINCSFNSSHNSLDNDKTLQVSLEAKKTDISFTPPLSTTTISQKRQSAKEKHFEKLELRKQKSAANLTFVVKEEISLQHNPSDVSLSENNVVTCSPLKKSKLIESVNESSQETKPLREKPCDQNFSKQYETPSKTTIVPKADPPHVQDVSDKNDDMRSISIIDKSMLTVSLSTPNVSKLRRDKHFEKIRSKSTFRCKPESFREKDDSDDNLSEVSFASQDSNRSKISIAIHIAKISIYNESRLSFLPQEDPFEQTLLKKFEMSSISIRTPKSIRNRGVSEKSEMGLPEKCSDVLLTPVGSKQADISERSIKRDVTKHNHFQKLLSKLSKAHE